MRVTIIGAGVIGLSTAWELSERGASVRVIESGMSGRETSWAAAGILPAARWDTATDPMERFRGLSHSLYPDWCKKLYEQSGVDSGLRHCGGIYLASSPGEAASLLGTFDYWQDLQFDVELLSPNELAKLEPNLSTWAASKHFRAALLSRDEYQIRPPDLLKALKGACLHNGVQIIEHAEASLKLDNNTARVSVDGDSSCDDSGCDFVVVCGGAWSGSIAEQFGLSRALIPVRGQIMMYRFDVPPVKRIVNDGHRYLVPRDDGRVLIGSCEEEVGFVKGTTREMLDPLREWAISVLPSIANLRPEKEWSGLRPGTFDGFPIIGKLPGITNLAIASGHYRSGVHLAPATARGIADQLYDVPSDYDLSAFAAGRLTNVAS